MQLHFVKLNNFRQFYGEQTIEFATKPEANLTVIHAENGVGKTTVLNALLWAFYEETTERFEEKDQILNFEAQKEGLTTASVSVRFEHEDEEYTVHRSLRLENGRSVTKVIAQKIEGGQSKPVEAVETFIASVLPPEMARYFFFDGEHAEVFAGARNQKIVAKAVRAMLGCEIADTAIADLKALASDFSREAGNVPGNEALERLNLQRARAEQTVTYNEAQIESLQREVEAWDGQLEKVEEYLRGAEGAKETHAAREAAGREQKNIVTDIAAAESDVLKWIGGRAVTLIARRVSQETLSFVDEASLRGKIPEPYNEDFVKGLLKAEVCCCNRCLKPETPEYAAVMALLKKASNAEILGQVVRARSRVNQLKETAADAAKTLSDIQGRVGRLHERRMSIEQRLSALDKKMAEVQISEIAEREQARLELKRKIAKANQDIGSARLARDNAQRELDEHERTLEKLVSQNTRAQAFLARRDLARSGQERLVALLAEHERSAREQIERSINKVLSAVARRDYRFAFGDDFSMRLLFADGRPVPRSSGENQLMSLAFTVALIEYSRLRAKASGEILTPGTIAPLVLDSPFGQLDALYRGATARFVPSMAGQVILLVSSSQGDSLVMEALESHIGAQYVLVSENRGDRGEKPEDAIVLRGREYHASIFNQEKTLTRVEKVH
jgi:DNA sulfur modification protein DndD